MPITSEPLYPLLVCQAIAAVRRSPPAKEIDSWRSIAVGCSWSESFAVPSPRPLRHRVKTCCLARRKGTCRSPTSSLLRTKWNETQLGQLVQRSGDEAVRRGPAEPDQEQAQHSRVSVWASRWTTWRTSTAASCAMAVTQPGNDAEPACDRRFWWTSRGTRPRPRRCWRRSPRICCSRGRRRRPRRSTACTATVFEMPKKRPDNPLVEAVYVIHKDMLVVTDRRDVCQHVVSPPQRRRLETR